MWINLLYNPLPDYSSVAQLVESASGGLTTGNEKQKQNILLPINNMFLDSSVGRVRLWRINHLARETKNKIYFYQLTI
jgi:hypothetical protein